MAGLKRAFQNRQGFTHLDQALHLADDVLQAMKFGDKKQDNFRVHASVELGEILRGFVIRLAIQANYRVSFPAIVDVPHDVGRRIFRSV